ncbi:MAG: hypothetical protein HQL05_04475 [Nitrospirae bacterium]|nr:hypothetical protein [Nitrospirota bacterium]
MLMITQELSKAVVALKDNPNWRSVLRWLDGQLVEQSLQNNSQRDEVLLRMGQGRALMLRELVKVFSCHADAGAPGVADPICREKDNGTFFMPGVADPLPGQSHDNEINKGDQRGASRPQLSPLAQQGGF